MGLKMVCDTTCAYREKDWSSTLTATLSRRIADHILVAAGVNGFAAYVFQIGEIKIGVLQGTITALALNLAHYLSHHLPGDEADDLRSVLAITGVFFASIYFFPDIAARLGKEVTFYQSFKFGSVSCLAITFCNRFYS